jgi:hypothetical protein
MSAKSLANGKPHSQCNPYRPSCHSEVRHVLTRTGNGDELRPSQAVIHCKATLAHPAIQLSGRYGALSITVASLAEPAIDADRYGPVDRHAASGQAPPRGWKHGALSVSLGEVVIWENRATQHKELDDYGEECRIVRRARAAALAR